MPAAGFLCIQSKFPQILPRWEIPPELLFLHNFGFTHDNNLLCLLNFRVGEGILDLPFPLRSGGYRGRNLFRVGDSYLFNTFWYSLSIPFLTTSDFVMLNSLAAISNFFTVSSSIRTRSIVSLLLSDFGLPVRGDILSPSFLFVATINIIL